MVIFTMYKNYQWLRFSLIEPEGLDTQEVSSSSLLRLSGCRSGDSKGANVGGANSTRPQPRVPKQLSPTVVTSEAGGLRRGGGTQ